MKAKRLLVLLAVVVGTIVPASPVAAYNLFGCQFTTGVLTWSDATAGPGQSTAAISAIGSWNSATDLTLVHGTDFNTNVRVDAANWGDTGWDGITLDNTGHDPISNSCGGGTWDRGLVAWSNRFYTDGYSSDGKKSIYVHELGHVWGLAHIGSGSTPCASIAIMNPFTARRFTACGKSTPQPDDISGVNFMY